MRHQELLEPMTIAVVVLAYLQAVVAFVSAWRVETNIWQTLAVVGMGMVWSVVVAGSVLICALFASGKRVRGISLAGAIWLWMAVLVSIVGFVLQVMNGDSVPLLPLAVIGFLIDLAFKGVLAVLLTRIWRNTGSLDEKTVEAEPVAIDEVSPAKPPIWEPENAVGQQWMRAGDAATGAPAIQPNSGRGRWQADSANPQANWAAIESRPLSAPDDQQPEQD